MQSELRNRRQLPRLIREDIVNDVCGGFVISVILVVLLVLVLIIK
jgi:hypothetical protein